MGTELYLILLVICSAIISRQEITAALTFTAVAFLAYFVCSGLPTLVVLNLCMVGEMITVALLVCLRGCTRSTLVSCLIPISIGMIFLHLYGIYLYKNEYELSIYNEWVRVYYLLVIGLFLARSTWITQMLVRWKNGSIIQSARLLRDSNSKSGIV